MYTVDKALSFFAETAVPNYHKAALSLVASAAIVFMVEGERTLQQINADLIAAATVSPSDPERTLGRTSAYRYVGLGRRLVARLRKEFPAEEGKGHGGVIADALDARTPEAAVKVLLAYLGKQGITVVEGLTTYLGAYVRGKPLTRTEGEGKGEGAVTPRAPRRVSTESIVATVGASTPEGFLDLMRELASQVNDLQVARNVRSIWTARIEELSEDTKPSRRKGIHDGDEERPHH